MQIISHRVNTIHELKSTPLNYGVEIDLRDSGDKLILQHDPFSKGEDFEEFLKYYQHRTIILNIKAKESKKRFWTFKVLSKPVIISSWIFFPYDPSII